MAYMPWFRQNGKIVKSCTIDPYTSMILPKRYTGLRNKYFETTQYSFSSKLMQKELLHGEIRSARSLCECRSQQIG